MPWCFTCDFKWGDNFTFFYVTLFLLIFNAFCHFYQFILLQDKQNIYTLKINKKRVKSSPHLKCNISEYNMFGTLHGIGKILLDKLRISTHDLPHSSGVLLPLHCWDEYKFKNEVHAVLYYLKTFKEDIFITMSGSIHRKNKNYLQCQILS